MDSSYELRKRRKLGLANTWKFCLTIFVTWASTHAHTWRKTGMYIYAHTGMHICVCTYITYQSILLIVTHHYVFEGGKEECGGDGKVKARAVLILLKKIQVLTLIVVVQSLSCVWLFVTSWTVACQAPLSTVFPKQEYRSGLPFPSPGNLTRAGIEPMSPALAGGFLTTEPPGKPTVTLLVLLKKKRKKKKVLTLNHSLYGPSCPSPWNEELG